MFVDHALAYAGAALLLATTLAACMSSQRFAPARQPQAVLQAAPPQAQSPVRKNLGGPFTREREDCEFGQQK